MRKDLIASVFCLALAIFLLYSLGWIDDERARAFPRVVIIIMGILSFFLLLQTLLMKKTKKMSGKPFPWRSFSTMLVLIIVYCFLMEKIGFYTTAFLFFLTVSLVFGKTRIRPRQIMSYAAMGVAFTGVIYFLFKIILKVQTPSGLLF